MSRREATEHTLVASTNRGKFSLDDGIFGEDISTGCELSIWLAGQWITGTVHHSPECYPGQSRMEQFEPAQGPAIIHGYYFEANAGGICGLCIGQKVRLAPIF